MSKNARLRKLAGGPGSGVSYDNTSNIEGLDLSPSVRIYGRTKVMEANPPSEEGVSVPLDRIKYVAQKRYVVAKLGRMLSQRDTDWLKNPIKLYFDGEHYHVMDGHHRFLAAKRKGYDAILADVWDTLPTDEKTAGLLTDYKPVNDDTISKHISSLNEQLEEAKKYPEEYGSEVAVIKKYRNHLQRTLDSDDDKGREQFHREWSAKRDRMVVADRTVAGAVPGVLAGAASMPLIMKNPAISKAMTKHPQLGAVPVLAGAGLGMAAGYAMGKKRKKEQQKALDNRFGPTKTAKKERFDLSGTKGDEAAAVGAAVAGKHLYDKNKKPMKKTAEKGPPTSSLSQDFAAGLDPFGAYTSEYGRRAQQAKLSEGEHRKKQMVGTVGGVVGGAMLVPSATSAILDGASALSGAGSVRQRLARAGVAAAQGAVKPVRGIVAGRRATKALSAASKATKATKLTPRQMKATEFAVSNVPSGTFISRARAMGRAGSKPHPANISQDAYAALQEIKALRKQKITPEMARAALPYAQAGANKFRNALAIGGTVGGAGAYMQYGKGRSMEKDFEQRLKKEAQKERYDLGVPMWGASMGYLGHEVAQNYGKVRGGGKMMPWVVGGTAAVMGADAIQKKLHARHMKPAATAPPKPKPVPAPQNAKVRPSFRKQAGFKRSLLQGAAVTGAGALAGGAYSKHNGGTFRAGAQRGAAIGGATFLGAKAIKGMKAPSIPKPPKTKISKPKQPTVRALDAKPGDANSLYNGKITDGDIKDFTQSLAKKERNAKRTNLFRFNR